LPLIIIPLMAVCYYATPCPRTTLLMLMKRLNRYFGLSYLNALHINADGIDLSLWGEIEFPTYLTFYLALVWTDSSRWMITMLAFETYRAWVRFPLCRNPHDTSLVTTFRMLQRGLWLMPSLFWFLRPVLLFCLVWDTSVGTSDFRSPESRRRQCIHETQSN
jgi:hypothetical protein